MLFEEYFQTRGIGLIVSADNRDGPIEEDRVRRAIIDGTSGWHQRAPPVNTGHDDEITLRQV